MRTLDFNFVVHDVVRYCKRVRNIDLIVSRSNQLLLNDFEEATQLLLHNVLLVVSFLSNLLVCNDVLQFLFSISLIFNYAFAFCSKLVSLFFKIVQSLIDFVVFLLQSSTFQNYSLIALKLFLTNLQMIAKLQCTIVHFLDVRIRSEQFDVESTSLQSLEFNLIMW